MAKGISSSTHLRKSWHVAMISVLWQGSGLTIVGRWYLINSINSILGELMQTKNSGEQLSRRAWLAASVSIAVTPILGACGGGGGGGGGGDEIATTAPQSGVDTSYTAPPQGGVDTNYTAPPQGEVDTSYTAAPQGRVDTSYKAQYYTTSYSYVDDATFMQPQLLDFYKSPLATVASPGPVYIWAHANDTDYRSNLPNEAMRGKLLDLGVSVISWRSAVGNLNTGNASTLLLDSYTLLRWVRKYASFLGIDRNRIVLGGASRGTYASWRIGHDPAHASFIKGMFMKQALPGSVESTKNTPTVYTIDGQAPASWVIASSPKIKFMHVATDNFHSILNSDPVRLAYTSLSIGDKCTQHQEAAVDVMDGLYLEPFVKECLGIAASPPPRINFSDNFDSFNSANYTVFGPWSAVAGELRQADATAGVFGRYCVTGDTAWADYQITAVVKTPSFVAGATNVSRVVARFVDGNNYYEAYIGQDSNLYFVSRKAGVNSTPVTASVAGTNIAAFQTLTLSCRGSTIKVLLNGVERISVTNTDHAAGKTGVRSYQCATSVDSLAVVAV